MLSGQHCLTGGWSCVTEFCSRSPEGWVPVVSVPFKCALSLIQETAPSPQIEAALEQDGLEQVLDVGQDALWGSPGTPARDPDLSRSAASARASNGCPLPIQMQCQV